MAMENIGNHTNYTNIHKYVCIYVHVYIYIYEHVYIYVYLFMCIYIFMQKYQNIYYVFFSISMYSKVAMDNHRL